MNALVERLELRTRILPLAGIALLLCWPLLAGQVGFLSPGREYVDLGTSTLISVMLVYSLNIAMGYTGLLSLMHAGFLGLGGYAAGFFASRHGWPIIAVIAVALAAGAAIGAFSASISLRATYLYFGIITLSLNNVLDEIAKEWRGVTLGEDGISAIPNRIDVIDGVASPRGFHQWFGTTPRYLIVLAVTLGVVILHANLVKSRTGRAFQAVRESSDTASALGIRVASVKITAFALSGAIGALAGVFFAYHRGFINPSIIAASPLVLFTGLLLGGSGTLVGPFIGVVLYAVLEKTLTKQHIIERHPLYFWLVLGTIIWILLLAVPKGIAGSFQASRASTPFRHRRRLTADDTAPTEDTLSWASADAATANLGEAILVATGVTKSFGGIKALQSADLTVEAQQIHAIMGPNGCGKSTFVNCITQYLHPDAGTVTIFGQPAPSAPERVAAAGVIRVFQVPHLFERVSALENVLTGMHLRARQSVVAAMLRLPSFGRDERAMRIEGRRLLRLAGLGDRADELAANLSHGQKRLLEVVRAVAAHPKILILDEPATGLTSEEVRALAVLVRTLRDGGLTIVLIEHNVGFVMDVSDVITVMEQGRVIAVGTPAEIQNSDEVQRAYLGGGDVIAMLGA
jgi:ABC-type branched-subunit amino acid transport system ATPase component/ABC-type branched-subunit amino acid transport system permease subunit